MDRSEARRRAELILQNLENGDSPASRAMEFVSVQDVEKAHREGCSQISILPGAIVTPLAGDAARMYEIELHRVDEGATRFGPNPAPAPRVEPAGPRMGSIAIGSDHGGFDLKEQVVARLGELGYEVDDVGTDSNRSVDYPVFAERVARKVAGGQCDRGIVIDGAGIGSSIVANKFAGIRAAHCHNLFEVRNSREHNNANVLSLGGRVIGELLALSMVEAWLGTEFEGGRHKARVDLIDRIDQRERRGR